MVRLHPREPFSVFTKPETHNHCLCASAFKPAVASIEVEMLEKLFNESKLKITSSLFCRKIAARFNCSARRAGNSLVNWTEVKSWFSERQKDHNGRSTSLLKDHQTLSATSTSPPFDKAIGDSKMPEGQKFPDISQFQFEAKSTDGAWYDVDMFLDHRYHSSGEAEVLVRYTGFGAEEDEWVDVKKAVRERSIPLEHWECHKLKVGHSVLCFQERRDWGSHYDGRIIQIQRRMHDITVSPCFSSGKGSDEKIVLPTFTVALT